MAPSNRSGFGFRRVHAESETHHWTGVTLSMKNMFGVVPGSRYGWPKNTLHWAGIHESILDICATVRPFDTRPANPRHFLCGIIVMEYIISAEMAKTIFYKRV